MDKTNKVKMVIAALLIAIVAIASISYGNSQRNKATNSDPTKSSLPTIEESQKSDKNPSRPGDSQPAPEPESKPQQAQSNSMPPPSDSANQGVQPQLPQGRTPATGPVDYTLPIIVLGSLSGLYLAGYRRLQLIKIFDKEA